MARVLITGGAGNMGRLTAAELAAAAGGDASVWAEYHVDGR